MYSYDTNSFVDNIINYSNNSIILVFDFEKIIIHYKPLDIKFKKSTINFIKIKNKQLYNILSVLILPINVLIITKLISVIMFKYRPKVCWIENTYAAIVVGVLRKLCLCDKSIYLSGDWVANIKYDSYLRNVVNNSIFPILDYFACKLNDVVLNHVDAIGEARCKFWGRKIAKKESIYKYKLQNKANHMRFNGERNAICFIGNMREDSGLDVVIKSLSEIRKKQDIILKIIGPKKRHYEYFEDLTRKYKVEQYVTFFGFTQEGKFSEILSDCFCGLNVIITTTNNYSAYTIPGKIIHYLQYLLPVIVTKGSGPIVSSIKKNEMGLVIEPLEEEFIKAVVTIYDKQRQFRENIAQYIESLPQLDIKEMIDG